MLLVSIDTMCAILEYKITHLSDFAYVLYSLADLDQRSRRWMYGEFTRRSTNTVQGSIRTLNADFTGGSPAPLLKKSIMS